MAISPTLQIIPQASLQEEDQDDDEIQEEDLLGYVGQPPTPEHQLGPLGQVPGMPANDDQLPKQNVNLHIGMVQTLLPDVDLVFNSIAGLKTAPTLPVDLFDPSEWASSSKALSPASSPSPTSLRMWAKYFANRDPGQPFVTIPAEWMDFFTLMLLKGSTSDWASKFLQSQAQSFLANLGTDAGNYYVFSLPKSMPSCTIFDLTCSSNAASPSKNVDPFEALNDLIALEPLDTPDFLDAHSSSMSPDKKRGTKRGKRIVISESKVRRNERLHSLNKGFKPPSCKNKNCLGCATKPPLISSAVVRDLGASFYKVDPAILTDEHLNAKPSSKGAVGRQKAKTDEEKENAGEPSMIASHTENNKSKKARQVRKGDEAGTSKAKGARTPRKPKSKK